MVKVSTPNFNSKGPIQSGSTNPSDSATQNFNSKGPIQRLDADMGQYQRNVFQFQRSNSENRALGDDVVNEQFQFQRSNSEKSPGSQTTPMAVFQFQRSNSERAGTATTRGGQPISIPKVQFRGSGLTLARVKVAHFNSKGPIQSAAVPSVAVLGFAFQFQRSNSEFAKSGHVFPATEFQFQRSNSEASRFLSPYAYLTISIPKVQFRVFRGAPACNSPQNFNSKGPIQRTPSSPRWPTSS